MNPIRLLDLFEYKYGPAAVQVSCLRIAEDGTREYGDIKTWGEMKESNRAGFVRHRRQMPDEIVIDCDTEKQEKYVAKFLENHNVSFLMFKANKGVHIHTYWNGLGQLPMRDREEIRGDFLSMLNVDYSLKSERHTIALEYAPHWKSGKIKKCLMCFPYGKTWEYANWQYNKLETLMELLKKTDVEVGSNELRGQGETSED